MIIRTCEVGCLVVLSNRRRPDEARTVPPCCRNDARTVTVSQKFPLGDFTLFLKFGSMRVCAAGGDRGRQAGEDRIWGVDLRIKEKGVHKKCPAVDKRGSVFSWT